MSKKSFAQRQERDELGWISVFFRRKKRSTQEVKNEHNTCKDSRLMKRNKAKNLHLFLSGIMRKLKHGIRKEKPRHDKRLLGKNKSFQKSFSTKDHFFLERMTSISQKISDKEQDEMEKHLFEMLTNGDFYHNLATSKQVQRNQTRIVSLPEYSSPFSSPGRLWNQNSILVSATDDFKKSEIIAGEARIQPFCIKLQENNDTMDEKESVFKYVKAVLDATESNWEKLYLRTEFSDQLLNPALIRNIPFYPDQLCVDHELLFDCINEVLFEFCRFPQWVSFLNPKTQVSSFNVQEAVYCNLLPFQLPQSLDQILRGDMAKPRNWLDIRCDLECIGFETSELILNELLEQLMLFL